MAFQFINVMGGVVIPGTAYVEYSDENGHPEYEVIADVFDASFCPGQSVNVAISRTPYFSIAEWNCELANTGAAPPFDFGTVLPSIGEAQKIAI